MVSAPRIPMPDGARVGLAPAGRPMRHWGVSTGSVRVLGEVRAPEATAHAAEGVAAPALDFDAVFRRYAPYVGAIALRLVGRPVDVDDIVQDVFIQAHRGWSQLRDPEAVRPWLTRIAVRRSRRWLKRHWYKRLFAGDEAGGVDEMVDPSASPEQRAEVAGVYRALGRMPVDDRVVWVLRAVDGETLESIASLVGCSLSTVQRRFRSARAFMERLK
jgi:RNA polymerase sigma-70 factor, ECF subfamily